ncbi:MAG: hypothetical protein KDC85_14100 [Saprospiraceae bacterium]|nr:hypothetical protein [Saprospiraceae bacterium]MCB9323861.1 hypothetical protein [Lewinellaceae bacterium]
MRRLTLVCLFQAIMTLAFSQNYYVAIVKGQVYYENKLIEKKDKIKLKGNLKFSSSDDYVKISGPGGIYTIKPGDDPKSQNEFLVAVREELFPKTRTFVTALQGKIFDFNSYFDLMGNSTTFFEKAHLRRPVPELKEKEELGFLHETNHGLYYVTAQIEDSLLVIRKKDFMLPKIKGERPVIRQTAIVEVTDRKLWEELLSNAESIEDIKAVVPLYGEYFMSLGRVETDPETGEEIKKKKSPPTAIILDFMGPSRFIKRREFVKDMRFYLKLFKSPDAEAFLDTDEFMEYLDEAYGSNIFDLDDVLRNDLHLKRFYD